MVSFAARECAVVSDQRHEQPDAAMDAALNPDLPSCEVPAGQALASPSESDMHQSVVKLQRHFRGIRLMREYERHVSQGTPPMKAEAHAVHGHLTQLRVGHLRNSFLNATSRPAVLQAASLTSLSSRLQLRAVRRKK